MLSVICLSINELSVTDFDLTHFCWDIDVYLILNGLITRIITLWTEAVDETCVFSHTLKDISGLLNMDCAILMDVGLLRYDINL